MEVVWTDAASQSLENIAEYLTENFSESTVRTVVDKIISGANMLGEMPRIGKRFESLNRYGEVRCLVSKYSQVYYHIKNDTIKIIAVWDCRRNPEVLLNTILDYFRELERT